MALLTITPTNEQVDKITQSLNENINKIIGVVFFMFVIGVVVYYKTR